MIGRLLPLETIDQSQLMFSIQTIPEMLVAKADTQSPLSFCQGQ